MLDLEKGSKEMQFNLKTQRDNLSVNNLINVDISMFVRVINRKIDNHL